MDGKRSRYRVPIHILENSGAHTKRRMGNILKLQIYYGRGDVIWDRLFGIEPHP